MGIASVSFFLATALINSHFMCNKQFNMLAMNHLLLVSNIKSYEIIMILN